MTDKLHPIVKVVPTQFTGTLKYKGKHLYIDLGPDGVQYFGQPSPQIDEAWDKLLNGIGEWQHRAQCCLLMVYFDVLIHDIQTTQIHSQETSLGIYQCPNIPVYTTQAKADFETTDPMFYTRYTAW